MASVKIPVLLSAYSFWAGFLVLIYPIFSNFVFVKTHQIQDNITKADIVNEIAKTTGIDKPAVLSVVEQFMAVVKYSLAYGENVYLRGFGSFIVKTRAEKTARYISKNTTLVIPAHNIPAFYEDKQYIVYCRCRIIDGNGSWMYGQQRSKGR